MSSILHGFCKVIKCITVGTLIIIPGYLLSGIAVAIIIPITAITWPIEYILFEKTTISTQLFDFAFKMTILRLSVKLAYSVYNSFLF